MKNFPTISERKPFAKKVILLVEDDSMLTEMLEGILEIFASYQVVSASNAFQALHFMRRVHPDLFLFDYQLPAINGLEFYRRLHAQQAFANIPVLFVSAVAPKEIFEEEHLPYIGKPFEMDDLLQKISELLTSGQNA
jgi:CheY-like chemotaxis protein